MSLRTATHSAKRLKRTAVLAALCLLLPAGSALAFFGGFSGIVFDPSNFLENVHQAVALLETIDRATTQIRLQRRMLAHLPVSVADALAVAAEALHGELNIGFSVSGTDPMAPAAQVDSLYPIVVSGETPAWLEIMRPIWTEAQRNALLHERDVYNKVHEGMAPSAGRLTELIEASNGAHSASDEQPGIMAGVQAHHELLAVCSGEADKLLALRAVRAKRRIEARARAQSEAAYHIARRGALMSDWEPADQMQSPPASRPF